MGKPDLESLQAGNQTREYAVFQKRPLSRYVPHNTCDPSWNPCPYTGKDVLPSDPRPPVVRKSNTSNKKETSGNQRKSTATKVTHNDRE